MELNSTTPAPAQTSPVSPRQNSKYLIFIFIFVLISTTIAFVIGGFVLAKKYAEKKLTVKISTIISSPTPTPTPSFKKYENVKYGFELLYPAKGITEKENKFKEAECGNAIKETNDGILVDNFFLIRILNWQGTLDDYLVQKGAKNIYDFKKIETSNADEALEVIDLKKGLEVASIGYPPLMYISSLYKNNNMIFLFVHLPHPPNQTDPKGCLNPKDLDPNKFAKYVDQKWDIIQSFKFLKEK
ncbi:hypothetical protein C4559_03870 [Candidatus Microgenomates bacterium]|nr:MAG: hypothetical protein C4559_03870 [Candidatus Microgenomates bacterium]